MGIAMIVKAFEIRDRGTFIPVLAVKMVLFGSGFNVGEKYHERTTNN